MTLGNGSLAPVEIHCGRAGTTRLSWDAPLVLVAGLQSAKPLSDYLLGVVQSTRGNTSVQLVVRREW